MIVEDVYRVLCGTQPIRVCEYINNRKIFDGMPDNLPFPVLQMQVAEIKATKTGKIIIYV